VTVSDLPGCLSLILERTSKPTTAADQYQDEHVRYELYLEALVSEYPNDFEVLAWVVQDPDVAMRETAIGAYVDAVGRLLVRVEDFQSWYDERRHILDTARYPGQRAAEWLVYKAILSNHEVDSGDYMNASAWLQRELAADAPSVEVVHELAKGGKSKQIRQGSRASSPEASLGAEQGMPTPRTADWANGWRLL
jgi:hypothetical protein